MYYWQLKCLVPYEGDMCYNCPPTTVTPMFLHKSQYHVHDDDLIAKCIKSVYNESHLTYKEETFI